MVVPTIPNEKREIFMVNDYPTQNIPLQLQNPELRFYLIGTNSKLPLEKSWNKDNCFFYKHTKLLGHQGNYGVATGYSNLIVIDFDDKEYHEQMKSKMPKTF